mgnify:FL=1
MAAETKLETVYYDVEARTQKLKPQIEQAKKIIDDVAREAVQVPITADPTPLRKVQAALSDVDAEQRRTTRSKDDGTRASREAERAAAREQAQLEAMARSALKEADALRRKTAAADADLRQMTLWHMEALAMDERMASAAQQSQNVAQATQGAISPVNQLTGAFRGLAGAAITYKAIQYTKEALQLADAYSSMRSRLALVTTGTADLNQVQARLLALSNETRSDLSANVALYTSLFRATKSLGLSQAELLGITKTVNQAFLVSGATTAEQTAAVRQLGQALASGVLRGDEFNSIAENAPRLQQAVADSLGITIGQLRQYAAEGKITADVVTKALKDSAAAIDAEAKSIALTVGGAMTQVKNELLVAIGQFDKASGASAALAHAIAELGRGSESGETKVASFAERLGIFTRVLVGFANAAVGGFQSALGVLTPWLDVFDNGQARITRGFESMRKAANEFYDASNGVTKAAAPTLAGLLDSTVFTPFGAKGKASPVAPLAKTAADPEELKRAANAAQEAQDEFAKLAKSAREFGEGLATTENPVAKAIARNREMIAALDALIPKLEKTKQAAARTQVQSLIGALAVDVERLRNAELEKLTAEFDDFSAAVTRNATTDVTAAYQKRLDALFKLRKELEAAGESERVWQSVLDERTLRKEQAELEALTTQQTAYEQALKVVTQVQQQADAAYVGKTASKEEYLQAMTALVDIQNALKEAVESGTLSVIAQAKAEALLAEVAGRRRKLEGSTPVTPEGPTREAVSESALLAAGLVAASNAAAALAENLGESTDEVGRLAAAGLKLANILKAASDAQKALQIISDANKKSDPEGKGAVGSLESLGQQKDTIALVVGAVVAVGKALDVFGDKAKQRTAQLQAIAAGFNDALASFAKDTITDTSTVFEQLSTRIQGLADTAYKSFGIKAGTPDGLTNSAAIRAQIADLEKQRDAFVAQAKRDQLKGNERGANANANEANTLDGLAKRLAELAAQAEKAEAALRAEMAAKLASAKEDLQARRLAATGDQAAADARTLALEQQRELTERQKEFAGTAGLDEYIAELIEVQALELQRAETLRAQAQAQRQLDDELKAFGLSGAEALAATMRSLAEQFPAISDALDGLDLTTQDGLDALKARTRALFESFRADGVISDDEQKILDALFRIYDGAVDVFDSLAERINRALAKVADDNEILGGDARTQLGRTVKAATGLNAALDAILGTVDLSTGAGAEALREQLRSFYASLAADADPAIVTLVKQLLGSLANAIDESAQEAEAAIARGVADRARARQDVNRRNAVNDTPEVQAFTDFLSTLAPRLGAMFQEFDVTRLDSIDAAKQRLSALNATVESLSETGALSKFGITRDELLDGILALDSSLDSLKASAIDAAEAALSLANRQRDLTASSEDEFLRASGRDREADLNAARARTAQRLEEARALGVSQATIDQIIQTGELTLQNINRRYDEQQASSTSTTATAVSAPSVADTRTTAVVSGVTSMNELQAVRMLDVETSQLLVLRGILAAVGGPLPQLRVPALPAGVGGFTGGNTAVSGGTVYNVVVQLPASSAMLITKADLDRFARQLGPSMDQEFRRRANAAASTTGGAL